MSSLKYRPDIDGLRALAVLSVVLFHIDERYLPGGFLGVDWFFVISGFLITKIIYAKITQDNFSFVDFYHRRARRILPALFFMVVVTLISGVVILLPYDFYKLGVAVLSVLFFSSNVQYAFRTGDYFSGSSSEWHLLHTWSLAVEEQYYFLFPVMLMIILKFIPKKLYLTLFVLTIFSFTLAQFMSLSGDYSKMSYYLIVTRMGEMLIGTLAAIAVVDKKIKPIIKPLPATLSLITLIVLLFSVNERTVFPGVVSLLACLPIGIIILSMGTWVNSLLSNKILVSIGLISFSLYLFHWPVLAYTHYVFSSDLVRGILPIKLQLVTASLMLALSYISYKFVEQPFRNANFTKKTVGIIYFAVPSIVVGVFAFLIVNSKGMPSRLDTDAALAKYQFNHIDKEQCPSMVNLGCVGGADTQAKKIVLFGNSHAEHYYVFVDLIAKSIGYGVSLYASGGCSLSSRFQSSKCASVLDAYNENKHGADIIVLAFRLDGFTDKSQQEFIRLIRDAKMTTENVIVLAQPPLWNIKPSKVYNCQRLGFGCEGNVEISSLYPSYNMAARKITVQYDAIFIDPYEDVTDKYALTDQGRLLYADDDHLSVYGAKWLYHQFDIRHLVSMIQ